MANRWHMTDRDIVMADAGMLVGLAAATICTLILGAWSVGLFLGLMFLSSCVWLYIADQHRLPSLGDELMAEQEGGNGEPNSSPDNIG